VVVIGEDVGVNGGVFRATAGLHEKFGDERVIDTPLAEVMIAGCDRRYGGTGHEARGEAQFERLHVPDGRSPDRATRPHAAIAPAGG
jgi:pyruvate/2-oxoglutarate/acetoin dehydrogenase E1 component